MRGAGIAKRGSHGAAEESGAAENCTLRACFRSSSGDFEFLNSLEYQIPILANDHLYAVAFIDSGTVENHVEIRDYRVSAGVGLRIVVPMLGPVPIALDLGFPIVKGPEDKEQVFSFWVGFFH